MIYILLTLTSGNTLYFYYMVRLLIQCVLHANIVVSALSNITSSTQASTGGIQTITEPIAGPNINLSTRLRTTEPSTERSTGPSSRPSTEISKHNTKTNTTTQLISQQQHGESQIKKGSLIAEH